MTEHRTIAYRELGSLLVTVHSHLDPSDAEWDAYLSLIVQHRHRAGPGARMLSWALGGVVSASQRARMVRVVSQPVPVAVLTSSPRVRGVATALSWFNAATRCFAPDQIDEALGYLRHDRHEASRVLGTLSRLCRELGLPVSPLLDAAG